MRGAVWGLTIQRAKKQLKKIKEKYIQQGIKISKEFNEKNSQTIIFENGDYWRTLIADDSQRAYRTNISYIDELIPKIIINVVILPSVTAPPYNAFNYFQV